MRNPWALEYAKNPDRFIWGTAPSQLARDLATLAPLGARVLDLGCGEGRDSVYFASRGYDVTGLDVSAARLERAERLANERGVTVRWLCRSMLDLPVAGRFDLVYSCGSIHHVPRDDRRQLFRRLRTLTQRGGIHAHIVFTDVVKYGEKGEEIDYFAPGELGHIYAAWRAISYEEGLIACSQDGTHHSHSIEQLVTSMAWDDPSRVLSPAAGYAPPALA